MTRTQQSWANIAGLGAKRGENGARAGYARQGRAFVVVLVWLAGSICAIGLLASATDGRGLWRNAWRSDLRNWVVAVIVFMGPWQRGVYTVVESLGRGQRLLPLSSLLGVLANLQQRRGLRRGGDCDHEYARHTYSHNMMRLVRCPLCQRSLRNTGIST